MKIDCRMKKIILIATAILALTACQKSMEDRAADEARAYTQKYCPTPVYNNTRTDSLVFDRSSRTFVYHCSLTDQMDDSTIIKKTANSCVAACCNPSGNQPTCASIRMPDSHSAIWSGRQRIRNSSSSMQHLRKKSISNQ